jgi:hypothetical protein
MVAVIPQVQLSISFQNNLHTKISTLIVAMLKFIKKGLSSPDKSFIFQIFLFHREIGHFPIGWRRFFCLVVRNFK